MPPGLPLPRSSVTNAHVRIQTPRTTRWRRTQRGALRLVVRAPGSGWGWQQQGCVHAVRCAGTTVPLLLPDSVVARRWLRLTCPSRQTRTSLSPPPRPVWGKGQRPIDMHTVNNLQTTAGSTPFCHTHQENTSLHAVYKGVSVQRPGRLAQLTPSADPLKSHKRPRHSATGGLGAAARVGFGGQNEAHDETVEAERLREDEDQDHADVELRLRNQSQWRRYGGIGTCLR